MFNLAVCVLNMSHIKHKLFFYKRHSIDWRFLLSDDVTVGVCLAAEYMKFSSIRNNEVFIQAGNDLAFVQVEA